MNRLRIGLVALVVGLAGLSLGMKDLLAGTACAPTRYGPLSPHLVCAGQCTGTTKCQAGASSLPGGRVTVYSCPCGAGAAAKCVFMVYVTMEGRVVPACVEFKCGKCSSPTYDVQSKTWGCACLR